MTKETDYAIGYDVLQRVLDAFSEQKGDVGLQVTIISPDGTRWSGVSGYASSEGRCPLTRDHHLHIGSVTKLYTAALVMIQVENGAISLEDSVDTWLDLPCAEAATVRQLLNHTSGIPSYTENIWFLIRYLGLPSKRWQPDELVAVIGKKAPAFEPGTQHAYSNSNYVLLGAILEAATGKRYGTLLHSLIADQLGLEHTTYATHSQDLLIANGYDETLLHLGRRNLTGLRTSLQTGAFSAGGILSTSDDVANFIHALFTGHILSDTALAQMMTFVAAPDEDMPLQEGYGLGVRNVMLNGDSLVGHTGSIPGYSSIAMHSQEEGYTIVVLSNLSVIEQVELLESLQQAMMQRGLLREAGR
jgi:D-alanyl-D-alanine carboxypeptidase